MQNTTSKKLTDGFGTTHHRRSTQNGKRHKMKKLLILLILLSSCSTPEQLMTTSTKIVKGDTITVTEYVNLTRQQRLALRDEMKHERKLVNDSLNYEIKRAKTINKRISDSLNATIKLAKIEIHELRLINQQLKDSLKYSFKEKKVDNKHVENVQKQEDKHEKKMAKKSNWWVWMLVGSIVTLIIIFIFRR